ncbi:hypothetical protein BT63DRAFT_150970 [Microthyrium microscopicum]|uniref:Uncharacterized protein n=1 Tax=Microthyrium microscopicum TaxID=703497 RepID=A0A6A6UP45_9PEZI|nr:hypothetical protein BT63DRAFT_150970 [Microthyrium microscopicum]
MVTSTDQLLPIAIHRCQPKHQLERIIFTWLILCGSAITVVSIYFSLSGGHEPNRISARSAGNEVFAQDIYGLGIRAGLYLQAISSQIVAVRPLRQPGGAAPMLFSTVVCISILGSWTRRAALYDISPAESIVVFNILGTNLATAFIGTVNGGVRGNAFGLCCWLVSTLWLQGAQLWFYPVGSSLLPYLGTENLT